MNHCIINDDTPSGRHLQCIYSVLSYCGRVRRMFKSKLYNWTSDIVKRFIEQSGDSEWCDSYRIVRKNVTGAYNAFKRYDRVDHPQDERLWNIAYEWMCEEFYPHMSCSEVYNYDAVREYLVDTTSPGYPMILKYASKSLYLDGEDGKFYSDFWARLATDDPIECLDAISVKVELRTAEKVESDMPRTIIAVDCNMSVAGQQLFLDQNIRMNETHGLHSSYVGMDVYGGGWNRLAGAMSVHPNSYELDGAKFDGRFHNKAQDNICKFRKKCLRSIDRTPDNLKRIDNYYAHAKSSLVVQVDGRIFFRLTGKTSGDSNTVNDNSLKNYQDCVVVYHILVPVHYHTYAMFKRHVKICIVGDDLGISVSNEMNKYFNAASIIAAASLIGMEYTTPTTEPRRFVDTSFLSSRFVARRIGDLQFYLPVLDCIKTKCSILHGNEKSDVLYLIQRLCNMRVVSFGCESCTDWICRLADYIKQTHRSDPIVRTPAWAKSWSGWKSDEFLVRLYTGLESLPLRDFISSLPENSDNHHFVEKPRILREFDLLSFPHNFLDLTFPLHDVSHASHSRSKVEEKREKEA